MTRDYHAEREQFAAFLLADTTKGERHRVGDEVVGRCPLPDHEDRKPSFRFNVVLDCSACSCAAATGKGSTLRALLDWKADGATGWTPQPNAPARRSPSLPATPGYATEEEAVVAITGRVGGEEVGRWNYTKSDGSPSFTVLRIDTQGPSGSAGKEYRPLRRDPDGRWRVGGPCGLLPLYRLPQIAAARLVVVVEGEKCADALAALGFDSSTTSAHGAKAAGKTDWAPLAGKDVVILPDNDQPGEEFARDVTDRLRKLTPPARPRILRLPDLDELGTGADVYDWIARRREAGADDAATLSVLAALIEKAAEPARRAELVTISDVTAIPLRPLWPGRLFLGKTAVLAGDPGLGKSCVLLDIIARVTKGSPWPDEPLPARYREPADAILLSAEDDEADTIRPRLEAIGADLKRVHLLKATKSGATRSMFRLDTDLDVLEDALRRLPNVRVVGLDPISAYLGAADSHVNSDVRALLAPLGELASKFNVAIIALNHLNKGSGKAMYRVSGSLAFVAAPRAGLLIVADKDNRARRLMLPTKNNLGPEAAGLAYRIEAVELPDLGSLPRIVWEPNPLPITADDALADEGERDEDRNCRDDAAAWLMDFLKDGPRTCAEAKKAGEALGHSYRTLERAKARLRIRSLKVGSGGWKWTLPGQDRHEDRQDRHSQSMAALGESGELCEPNGTLTDEGSERGHA